MRLNSMKISRSLAGLALLALSLPVLAQRAAPPGTGETFKDTSMLKPPPGVKVAIIEFQDL